MSEQRQTRGCCRYGQRGLFYDTEKRLQQQGLAPRFSLSSWVIEAGPKYFEGANTHVGAAIQAASEKIKQRDGTPYVKATPASAK